MEKLLCLGFYADKKPPDLNVIPGKGCGNKNPFKTSPNVPENEDDRPCTIVTDNEAFEKYKSSNKKGKHE